MLKWEFSVSGQSLTRTDRLDTYADMVGQLQAEFDLDDWWDDYIVIAQFVRDGIPELRVVQNGICDVPDRVLKGAGVVYISLYAVAGSTRKTTNEINISIEPSGIRRDSLSPSKPSGDVWEQTLDLLGGIRYGEKGQCLQKRSDDNYDFEFVDLPESILSVTANANTAATAANTAATAANTAATAANTATTNAETATANANTAADRAEQAASTIFDGLTANDTSYDNTISGLNGETVQEAIDELSSSLDNLAGIALRDITSWSKVQEIVRAGFADRVFNIGDQFTVMKGATPLVFDVIGIDHDIPTDSTKTHSMTLQLHDCLMNLQFDAAELTNPDTGRKSFGSNNWLESGLRQWLNAIGNDWWSAKTEYDVAPTCAATTAGFLSDIDSEFLSVIGNVKKITTKPSIDGGGSVDSDEKIFLLSRSEVYGGNENSINEGMAYPYYSDNSSLPSAGTEADVNRIKYLSGVARQWWLRSPNPAYTYAVRGVYTDGTVNNGSGAYAGYGVAPACCII